MRTALFALLIGLLAAGGASAQIGGNTVSKANTSTTLGYNQTQPTHGVSEPWYCLGAPISTNAQAQGYFVIYDAGGHPHNVPFC
jgi:hypothetical protein